MYKAIVTVHGKLSKVVEGSTPSELGTAIGTLIEADPLGGTVDVVYEVYGPVSRKMAPETETTESTEP